MNRFVGKEIDPKLVNPLALAFVGDTVYDLFVREDLVCSSRYHVGKLHALAVEKVKAKAQSEAAKKLLEYLKDEEKDVFMRCRNAHPKHLPKSASVEDYHYATALEGVVGYLYLKDDFERLKEIFEIISSDT
ncbi:MAG: ribonuclease III [Clostridia bacterium]|nr:ribonuclease III [Clostridia bacterium]